MEIELPVKIPWQVVFPLSFSMMRSSTWFSSTSRLFVSKISLCKCCLYNFLSICARCPQTAGPFLLFRILYWIPERSVRNQKERKRSKKRWRMIQMTRDEDKKRVKERWRRNEEEMKMSRSKSVSLQAWFMIFFLSFPSQSKCPLVILLIFSVS